MTPRAVALVESPAQLLNVIEWGYAQAGNPDPESDFGSGVTIMILAPLQPVARLQLERMSDLARGCGFTVEWREVRGESVPGVRGLRALAARIGSVPTLIIGDPFSGYLQFMISLSRARQLVVIDDGSATLEFADILAEGRPLRRWHQKAPASRLGRSVASMARQRMIIGPRPWNASNPLHLFTAMPVSHAGTSEVRRHTYEWTRSRFARPSVVDEADLIGTSLVESGVLEESHYLRAVRALARRYRISRYVAHRRESAAKLAKLSDLGLVVVRPDLPLEVFARIGPVGQRVISFPSTVVHTLPLALSDSPVEVLTCDLEQGWFSPAHDIVRSGRFLSSVTSTARDLHGLNTVAA